MDKLKYPRISLCISLLKQLPRKPSDEKEVYW
jgi:hypothetical protein